MTNGCQKGKAGEREAAHLINDTLGVAARRGQQYQGGHDSADIVVDIPGLHWEIKRVENLQLYKAMHQAIADRKLNDVPIVLHRKNHEDWLLTIPFSEVRKFAKIIAALPEEPVAEPIQQELALS